MQTRIAHVYLEIQTQEVGRTDRAMKLPRIRAQAQKTVVLGARAAQNFQVLGLANGSSGR